ncbi:DEAD/DEAH box helicase family protein [bacterium]|nr:DEAD/DEAH box helicase family protein [bacterium]
MLLRNYQEVAVGDLLADSMKLFGQTGPKKLVFRAPTGSGKTIMMAEFLKSLVECPEFGVPLAFIWTAPRKLHEQSKVKLEKYYENSRALECSFFEDLDDRQINEGEILFFNWESIRQENNVYIRENEQDNNLSTVLERTKDAGHEIVLIIDECHYHAKTELSHNIIQMIAPKLTIEVSATPAMEYPDEIVSVPLDAVKVEAMIKKSVFLNADFSNVVHGQRISSELAASTDEIVLREAIKKRNEIAAAHSQAGTSVNPLLLIQLPDRHAQADEDLKVRIEQLLKDQHGIAVENGKLGIYLSEDKENLENLTRNDNEAEVLMFKQAIALGWDCPRAQVMALFRQWSSPVFSVQTIGRLMRMPEPSIGHYRNDLLNHAYVYTNLDDIQIKEDIGKDYVTIYTSHRIKDYKPIQLSSVYRKRHREETRLSPLFIEIFLKAADEYGLAKRIKTEGQKVQPSFIAEFEAADVDTLAGRQLRGTIKLDEASGMDLQRLFNYFVRKNLSPFYPEERSIGRVKEAIYGFCRSQISLDFFTHFEDTLNVILSEENQRHFANVLDAAKEHYKIETQKRQAQLTVKADWEVPERMTFGADHIPSEVTKSVMSPFYHDNRWKTEKAFIKFLDLPQNNVLWWFKNGERDATFFAVSYQKHGTRFPFYVDFIVMLTDGRIGLFDTKSGRTIEDSVEKSDGLQHYTAKNRSQKVFGGIVANTDQRNFAGRWMVFSGKGEDLRVGDFSNWDLLEI